MKRTFSILALLGLLYTANAQTNTTPPVASTIWDYLTTGSNYWAAPYATASVQGSGFGGGIAVGYNLSQTVNPVLRLDYFNGHFYMPSLTAQLQPPVTLFGKFPVIPFGIAGAGTTIGGNGVNNGTMVTILGAGVALRGSSIASGGLLAKMDLVVDYEKWLGLPQNVQNQIRFGVLLKF